MAEVRLYIDGDAVKAHPTAQANADSGNLVLAHASIGKARLFRPHDPDANAVFTAFAHDVERSQRLDDPLFQ
ncbi:hypothetical protein IL60_0211165 [Brucella inopinata BO1]|nr:hypothetical protein IL60_0211165 [Brucella inopinata BO1]